MGDSSTGDETIGAPLRARWRLSARVPASDRELVEAAKSGSADALGELARRTWPDAYRVALVIVQDRAAAEDVAQDAIIAALEALPRFNPRRPLAPWLHRIVTNKALDVVRKRARRTAIDARLDPPPPAEPIAGGLPADLRAALLRLTAEERAAFVLRHLAGMTSREIARSIKSRPGTVRSMLRRTRIRLAADLEPKEDKADA
jgi:RNA polymerase sigma-70 factor, ECF subfamily